MVSFPSLSEIAAFAGLEGGSEAPALEDLPEAPAVSDEWLSLPDSLPGDEDRAVLSEPMRDAFSFSGAAEPAPAPFTEASRTADTDIQSKRSALHDAAVAEVTPARPGDMRAADVRVRTSSPRVAYTAAEPAVWAAPMDPDPAYSSGSHPISDVSPFDKRAALKSCLESIRAQLNTTGAQRKEPMGSVLYKRSRLLLHSWECESFRSPDGSGSTALQSAVAARALLADAQEAFLSSRNRDDFEAVIRLAEQQVAQLQESAERARQGKSVEIAANLSGSSKRLDMAIDKARKLLGGGR